MFLHPADGFNGLAVIHGGKVIPADIFGNEESYKYYFPMLRDAAFTLSHPGAGEEQIDLHEAYFKALAAIDDFNEAGRHPVEGQPGAGTLLMVETQHLVGFSLMHGEELIHDAFFARQEQTTKLFTEYRSNHGPDQIQDRACAPPGRIVTAFSPGYIYNKCIFYLTLCIFLLSLCRYSFTYSIY